MLTLRSATAADLRVLVSLARSPEVAPFLAMDAARRLAASVDDDAEALLVAEVDGAVVGGARLVVRNARSRISEIRSLMLDPGVRGRGLGTAVVRAVADQAFAGGVHRLEGEVLAFNLAAIRAFEAAGFTREGVRRQAYLRDDAWTDSVMLGRLADDPRRCGSS